MENRISFHLPTKPLSLVDSLNRAAAATGSPRYAAACADANYNGHFITVRWNEFNGYYIAEYQWAGRNVLMRGTARQCVQAGIRAYNAGGRGGALYVSVRPEDVDQIADLELIHGTEPKTEGPWWSGLITSAMRTRTEHLLMQAASAEEYDAAVSAYFAERRAAR